MRELAPIELQHVTGGQSLPGEQPLITWPKVRHALRELYRLSQWGWMQDRGMILN